MIEGLSDIERWQQEEDARLEYEGYCNKIRKGLEELDEKSGERALWELIQNARDMSEQAHIKIDLTKESIIFSHHGKPFDYTSFRALVKQDSSKDRNGADQVGQYGTGFMTTHAFNRMVYVSGPFVVKSGKDTIKGYVQIKDFELDRTHVDTVDGPSKMKTQLKIVTEFWKGEMFSDVADDTTSFRYDLTAEQVAEVSTQISNAIRLMPFVLTINTRIKVIEICNQHANEHFTLKKEKSCSEVIDKDGWKVVKEEILLTNHNTSFSEPYVCKSLQSDKGDVIIIPPFPKICGDVYQVPSLFLWFPLLGTEAFGVNFIFHSKRFYPVEKRNNIMLPGSTITKKEKGGLNNAVLKEMTEVLFGYYANDEKAKTLTRKMCEVSFPTLCEDEETTNFYNEMQMMWNAVIPNWKVLPIGHAYYAVSDPKVKLLHRDFYSQLSSEQKNQYEAILANYALLPKNADGESFLIPDSDIIAWSETVDRWDCDRDKEFFISVSSVCNAIKTKRDDLHSFLMLMKDSGNTKVMDEYPLLPNRAGELRRKNELYNASFMNSEVYDLVRVVMGEDSRKIYDTSFLDVCEVNPYTQADLQRAITSTMSNWRTMALSNSEKNALSDDQLSALINFCSASCMPEFNNARGRMMPLIAQFHSKEFKVINTIRFRDEDEEDFYKTAFNLLLDYTLSILCHKSTEWVNQNKEWLKSFLTEYGPSTNEEHKKRLNDYGVIPNQKGDLCLLQNLRRNNGVPELMATIYRTVVGSDLYDKWVDVGFEDIVTFPADEPKNIATEIEGHLVSDMKQESQDRKFEKTVRDIVLEIAESKEWEDWFSQINDKKATYTFSMKSGKAQKSLFSIMDITDENLDRLAKLTESGRIECILDRMERLQELERDEKARFHHLHTIGKHIEGVLRERIGCDLVRVDGFDKSQTMVDDLQNGQDIVIRIKGNDGWKDVYYIEVKSKWDFSEPAHMSTHQIRKAVLHPDNYALCCVDLRLYKDGDLLNLPQQTILDCTRVKMNIGHDLTNMMREIVRADENSNDVQIKISDYRSNISAKIFEIGEPIDSLIKRIEALVSSRITDSKLQENDKSEKTCQ